MSSIYSVYVYTLSQSPHGATGTVPVTGISAWRLMAAVGNALRFYESLNRSTRENCKQSSISSSVFIKFDWRLMAAMGSALRLLRSLTLKRTWPQ